MAFLKVLGGPIPPSGKAFDTTIPTTLTADMVDVYSDSAQTYPKQHFAEYDVTNNRWKPLGGTDGDFWYLPGPDGAQPDAPLTKFTEVQVYDDDTTQTFPFWRRVIGDGSGVWDYSTPDPDVSFVTTTTGLPSGVASWANVKHPSFGAVGDGVADDLAAINLALASISTGGDLYFPPGTYLLSNNLTIPVTVMVRMDSLAKFSIATGKVLTLASPIDAGPFQLFSGAGTVAIGSTNPQTAWNARWWGLVGNGVTDDLANTEKAINAIGANKRVLEFPPGHYKFSDDITFPLNVTVRPHPGAIFEPGVLKGVIFTGPVDKGQWSVEGGTGVFVYAIPPPAPAMIATSFNQADGGNNWDADLDTRSGGSYHTVTLPFDVLRDTEPMVFNSTLGIMLPTAQYDRTGSVFVFLDGFMPIYDGTYAETIYIWAVKDGGG